MQCHACASESLFAFQAPTYLALIAKIRADTDRQVPRNGITKGPDIRSSGFSLFRCHCRVVELNNSELLAQVPKIWNRHLLSK